MKSVPINFFKEDVAFQLSKKGELKKWIAAVITGKKYKLYTINYIFCNDNHLLKMNKDYLKHNYFTDIITFNNSTEKKSIEADIFISIDRVKANALEYKTSTKNELHRVMIHGVLHLLGYKDKSAKDKKQMREMEDAMLKSRPASLLT